MQTIESTTGDTARKMQVLEDVERRFTYHAPKGNQPSRYDLIRDLGKQMALLVLRETPESREQSLAITKLEEAVMWANAAIARRE